MKSSTILREMVKFEFACDAIRRASIVDSSSTTERNETNGPLVHLISLSLSLRLLPDFYIHPPPIFWPPTTEAQNCGRIQTTPPPPIAPICVRVAPPN